ncbi:MAG: transglycosylase SLT domain-containing protein [Parvibaculaceae bacterium]
MKSVYALIPAALLAGTVLSVPVEARGVEDPSVHAERLSSRQKYFKTMAMKKPGKIAKARRLKARKTASEAKRPAAKVRRSAAKKRKPAAVAVKEKIDSKMHKVASADAASTAKKTRKSPAAAGPRQVESTSVKTPRFASMSLTKVLRSGPREMKKLPRDVKKAASGQAAEASDMRVIEVIREMAPSYGVPTWFALRIANVESGYNPYARGRAGEIGIYQLKCQTARGMGFEGDCSGLTDVRTNVRWGLKHLSLAIESSGGNLRLAASKHNAGLGRKSLVHSYIAKVF